MILLRDKLSAPDLLLTALFAVWTYTALNLWFIPVAALVGTTLGANDQPVWGLLVTLLAILALVVSYALLIVGAAAVAELIARLLTHRHRAR